MENLLDPVITSLASYYQTPECLPPLDPDPHSNCKPSDHRIVIVKPISAFENVNARTTKEIKSRPISPLGMMKMTTWLSEQTWEEVLNAETASDKAEVLQSLLVNKYKEVFPEKTHKICSDDQPWINHKLKMIDRRRKREYNKHRKSDKWHSLDKYFKTNVKSAKTEFYKKMMSELMGKNTSNWYSSLKKMTSHDQHKVEKIIIQDINHLSDEEQANKLADHFSEIPNSYDQLKKEDIEIEYFSKN